MKKLYKYAYVALLMTLVFSTVSCTEECEYTPAQAISEDCVKASFLESEDGFFKELTPDAEKKITLTVTREITDGECTVGLNVLENGTNIFNVPDYVNFADGESSKTFDITFPDAEVGVLYNLKIELDGQSIDPYAESTISTIVGSVQVVQWNPIGESQMISQFFEQTLTCETMKASHANWYKFVSLTEEGVDLVIKVTDNNEVIVEDQQIGTHASYGPIYVNNSQYGGEYNPETNTIVAYLYYYVSAGYFGTYAETFKLPSE